MSITPGPQKGPSSAARIDAQVKSVRRELEESRTVPLTTFQDYCTCGGFAHSMNGRDPRRPHMSWCPQRDEYNKWYDETHMN